MGQILENRNEPEIEKIIKSPALIFFDFVLRLSLIFFYKYEIVNDLVFWLVQIIGFGLLDFIVIAIISINEKKITARIRKEYEIPENVKLTFEGSGWLIIFQLIVIIIIGSIPFFLYTNWHIAFRILLSLACFAYMIFFSFMLNYEGSKGTTPKNPEIRKRGQKAEVFKNNHLVEVVDETDRCFFLDKNDDEIISMSTEISSAVQRVETYTLESALFGGLAFSGFLALLASEKTIVYYIGILKESLNFHPLLIKNLSTIFSENGIIGLISIETIICSMLFLSVIIARIRFTDILRNVDRNVEVAKAYNEKEEDLLNNYYKQLMENDSIIGDRINNINRKINEQIEKSHPLIEDMTSVINYMKLFRGLGIACFVLVLTTAALLVSKELSLGFIALYIVSSMYLTIDKLARGKRFEKILARTKVENQKMRVNPKENE